MQTIIAACITGGITLIGIIVNYFIQTKADFRAAEKHRENQTKTIIEVEEKNIDNLKGDISSVSSQISNINNMMLEEKTSNQYRYQNMSDAQKNIVDSVKTLESFSKEMGRLSLENKSLHEQYTFLEKDYQELQKQNQELIKQNKELVDQLQNKILDAPKRKKYKENDRER